MTLGIVDRNTVGRDIDSRSIGTADSHRRISHAGAGIGRRDERRGHLQQIGDVAAVVPVV